MSFNQTMAGVTLKSTIKKIHSLRMIHLRKQRLMFVCSVSFISSLLAFISFITFGHAHLENAVVAETFWLFFLQRLYLPYRMYKLLSLALLQSQWETSTSKTSSLVTVVTGDSFSKNLKQYFKTSIKRNGKMVFPLNHYQSTTSLTKKLGCCMRCK